jgi:hypothetical protein
MKAFGYWLHDWSLSRQHPEHKNWWMGIFDLKCALCRKWTLGCGETDCVFFCGICPPCKESIHRMEEATEEIDEPGEFWVGVTIPTIPAAWEIE